MTVLGHGLSSASERCKLECFTIALHTPPTSSKRQRGARAGSSLALRAGIETGLAACMPGIREPL
jgi:hypothetical protein